MDGMMNGDGMQIVMLLYDVDGFSDEEPLLCRRICAPPELNIRIYLIR